MKTGHKPVRTTIFFGLICALAYIPLNMALGFLFFRSETFFIIVWIYLAAYSLLLARWSETRLRLLVFPLLLLLGVACLVNSLIVFVFISLGVLCWIRSRICFPKSFFGLLVVDPLLCLGGVVAAGIFTPSSTPAWALGIWMFFLIQALYFVFFGNVVQRAENDIMADPFESAMAAAKKILSPDPGP